MSSWRRDHSARFDGLNRRKKAPVNLWGPVRGSFSPTGARRALDLAEVRLPLGRSLQGPLVLLIAGHDRSAPVQPELLSFLFLSPSSFSPLAPRRSHSPSLISLLSGPYLLLSLILHFSFSRSCHFFIFIFSLSAFPPSPRLLCRLIEGELRGGCSWRGPPCLVITSLFITRANGPRGEGNNNKLIEYELQLNGNLQHFILDRPVLWQMKRRSD